MNRKQTLFLENTHICSSSGVAICHDQCDDLCPHHATVSLQHLQLKRQQFDELMLVEWQIKARLVHAIVDGLYCR